jgi:hypothetical protein
MFMTAFQFFRRQILENPAAVYTSGHAKTNLLMTVSQILARNSFNPESVRIGIGTFADPYKHFYPAGQENIWGNQQGNGKKNSGNRAARDLDGNSRWMKADYLPSNPSPSDFRARRGAILGGI